MQREPHTIDEHDFGDECPDTVPICLDAFYELTQWIKGSQKPKSKTVLARFAAVMVMSEHFTASEAANWAGVSERRVNQLRMELHVAFDIKTKNGRVW